MGITNGSFHVVVKHRTHLGVMTAGTYALNGTAATVDLTLPATATFGTNARKTIGTAAALWAGDVNADGTVKYTNTSNDRDLILNRIGGVIPTNSVAGYWPEDVNMDGTVKYTGTSNDRDPILTNIGGVVPTNTRVQQLP
jgi:hypothetical protein